MKNSNLITTVVILTMFLFSNTIYSQNSKYGCSVSNNVTSFPALGFKQLLYSQFHPGVDVFKSWKINKAEKTHVEVKANAGFFYHRFVQTLVRIYPSISYSRNLGKRFNMGAGIGAGYGLSFEGNDVFVLNSEGKYETKSKILGRSQYLVNFEIGGNYSFKKDEPDGIRLFLTLKTFVQGTFVAGYVPVLPVNSLFLGISVPIKSKAE